MSIDNADKYADEIVAQIEADTAKGTPFGVAEEDFGDLNEGDELTALDWLEDALDIQYTVGSQRNYIGARVLIAFGGPNAWVNTVTGYLEVAWWSAPTHRKLPIEFLQQLDAALEELWESGS